MEKKKNPWRLSRDVLPVAYHLTLTPDLANFTFRGQETVEIEVKRPTAKITLHALDLKIESAVAEWDGEYGDLRLHRLISTKVVPNKKYETMTLCFDQTIKPGKARLMIFFSGELNDKMHGFYRTSYQVGGEKRWGAATQFEATDARRCFPCWDEPDRKATFDVKLVVPKGATALSNMPVQSEEPWLEQKIVFFQKTPKMSTYLLAFVIAELEHIEGLGSRGIPIRVWATPGKREQGRFALEVTQFTLDYFEKWFGIPYPLPKLDMVALPDFAAGAMENWGLITFREIALHIDPANSSAAAKQRVAEVVEHELAHMWFGDWTTMKWWTHLWLNEGYASYMGPKAMAEQFPEWDTWTQYVADDYLAALHEDSRKNTHAIEIEVANPAEIREIFDAISYSKGSVVNRMLEHYLGEEIYSKGLNRYLRDHALANATTNDLWRALQGVSGKPVMDIMASYTRQPGYPVVSVRDARGVPRKNGRRSLYLEQARFLFDGSKDAKHLRWNIPVGAITSKTKKPFFEYMKGTAKIITVNAGPNDWVKLNPGQSGFYRVAYPPEMLKALKAPVLTNKLPAVDRLGLLDDAFALARAGQVKTAAALDLLAAYRYEDNFSVWMLIAGVLSDLDNLLAGRDERSRSCLHLLARDLLGGELTVKGWDKKPNDSHLDVLLRSLVLRASAGFGHQTTVDKAQQRFTHYVDTGELDPDLRQAVYTIIAENTRAEMPESFLALMRIYDSTDFSEEKVRVLRALGALRSKELIRAALDFSMSEKVRRQDTPILLAGIGGNTDARSLAWEFIKANWDELKKRYHGGGFGSITRVFKGTVSGFTSHEALQDAEQFFRAHRVPGTERAVKQALETVRSNIAWLHRDQNEMADWLTRYATND